MTSDTTAADWYKDAVIYQTHVKAFFDANDDGIGDFAGLIEKLDYIQSLGVTAIWILPFYPSPLRDDGYDIADYYGVNPSYGTLADVRRLVKEAHRRGLKVITELVINHTSDQHAWFQRARSAKRDSWQHDFYVWSDDDKKFPETRIIFIDTEKSNWSWDPVAERYYWHRFYSHQPDLNFDNPRVFKEIVRALRFWLDMGIDGLRLDAIPYLVEREGTINENLPETHDVLKRIRAEVDKYPGRMLLAEANQWPEDVLPYFGDGNECHMAFHFPLMPRMYMAIAMEDRYPINDIMRQTPLPPEPCQWAIFLRNHDELTLEMVTNRERDYLWETYATDRRMRLNLGIRRRLAPLMDGDRRRLELLHGLLFSMPGTPVVYYGDEIGMGDNIFLGDRDGVRTPMQWSPDRNGGFSRADPPRLYLPPIMDSVYGFDAVNVERQTRDSSSFLNWMRRIIAVRQNWQALGRGSYRILYPGNRKILAYLREYADETILCVVNLSRSSQAVELDLSEFRERVPIELLGRSRFPPIGDLPYLLTLPGHAFYWFVLAEAEESPLWHDDVPEPLPEFVTLVMPRGWPSFSGSTPAAFETDVLPPYLPKQRWFPLKDRRIRSCRTATSTVLPGPDQGFLFAEVDVEADGDVGCRLCLPLAIWLDDGALAIGSPLLPYALAQVRQGARTGALYDATEATAFGPAVLAAMRAGSELAADDGVVRAGGTRALADLDLPAELDSRRLGVEQSNTSLMLGRTAILKVYRQLRPGIHPEIEIGRFLTDVAGFERTPALLGGLERIAPDGTPWALAAAHALVENQGDGWSRLVGDLEREFEEFLLGADAELELAERHAVNLALITTLGQRSAEMHRAFCHPTDDPAFAAEPVTPADLARWRDAATGRAEHAVAALERVHGQLDGVDRFAAERVLARGADLVAEIERAANVAPSGVKTRTHGDYHLGQVLVARNDFYIIDFEGEPLAGLEDRRRKTSALRDVAGMLRSLDYAATAAARTVSDHDEARVEIVRAHAVEWRDEAHKVFMASYREAIGDCPVWPADEATAAAVLRLFSLEKALYEVGYEAANRPAWLRVPLDGVLGLLPPDDPGADQPT